MSRNICRARLEYVRRIMMMKEQNSMDLLTDGGSKPIIITKGPHVSTRRYHVSCFAEARDEMVFFCSADKLAGYNTLSKDDQVRGDDRLEITILIHSCDPRTCYWRNYQR